MIKQIIFDFDGTLVDSYDAFISVGKEIALKYGYNSINEDAIKELMMLPMKKRIQALNIPFYKLPKLSAEAHKGFKIYSGQIKLIEGISETLRWLHGEGYQLSIVSSNSLNNINTFLNEKELQIFNYIQSSKGLFGKHITINKLISKLGANKEEVIYVGDEHRDVEACKKIGIKVISVLWGFDSQELIEKAEPDFIVSKPNEIIKIITEIKE